MSVKGAHVWLGIAWFYTYPSELLRYNCAFVNETTLTNVGKLLKWITQELLYNHGVYFKYICGKASSNA